MLTASWVSTEVWVHMWVWDEGGGESHYSMLQKMGVLLALEELQLQLPHRRVAKQPEGPQDVLHCFFNEMITSRVPTRGKEREVWDMVFFP